MLACVVRYNIGSHSKWAVIKQGGVIESFQTFMTGEIFALLAAHSILRFSLEEGGNDGGNEASGAHAGSEAFSEGVRAGHEAPEQLTHLVCENQGNAFLPRICSRTLRGCFVPPLRRRGRSNPSVTSRCGGLLLSLSADATCALLMTSSHSSCLWFGPRASSLSLPEAPPTTKCFFLAF